MSAHVMDARLLDYERLRGTYLRSQDAEVSKLHCLMALSLALYRLSNVHESWIEHSQQNMFEKAKARSRMILSIS